VSEIWRLLWRWHGRQVTTEQVNAEGETLVANATPEEQETAEYKVLKKWLDGLCNLGEFERSVGSLLSWKSEQRMQAVSASLEVGTVEVMPATDAEWGPTPGFDPRAFSRVDDESKLLSIADFAGVIKDMAEDYLKYLGGQNAFTSNKHTFDEWMRSWIGYISW
jgi:hypothetical protein